MRGALVPMMGHAKNAGSRVCCSKNSIPSPCIRVLPASSLRSCSRRQCRHTQFTQFTQFTVKAGSSLRLRMPQGVGKKLLVQDYCERSEAIANYRLKGPTSYKQVQINIPFEIGLIDVNCMYTVLRFLYLSITSIMCCHSYIAFYYHKIVGVPIMKKVLYRLDKITLAYQICICRLGFDINRLQLTPLICECLHKFENILPRGPLHTAVPKLLAFYTHSHQQRLLPCQCSTTSATFAYQTCFRRLCQS
jgi:hypothetical protein